VDYENLGGESKAAHARNLISYYERRERLEELVAGCRQAFPDLSWTDLLEGDAPEPASPKEFLTLPAGKVKILFLASNPADTPMLRLDKEARAIDEALRQAEYRQRFEIIQHWAVRVSDLQACLLRHEPNIIHFSGHGSETSEIVLENASGTSQALPAEALSRLFGLFKEHLRCVVLNACYTQFQAEAIADQIECVIGMSKAIRDEACLNFSNAFYQALGYGKDIQTAFELGCLQIDLQGLAEGDIPRLLAKRREPKTIIFL
jgi:hypothetical protein